MVNYREKQMSDMNHEAGLENETKQLLNGPLKHVKAAALAAVLVPLASLAAATPASAQDFCPQSGGTCGFVWSDTNGNGVQDAGEPGIPGVAVTFSNGTDSITVYTDVDGHYAVDFLTPGTYTVSVTTPQGTEPSPVHSVTDSTKDSDGAPDGLGNSVVPDVQIAARNLPNDFGFVTKAVLNPGTGTPGYWKNHPDAWPVSTITVGGVTYTKDQAISWMGKVGKDKTTTMFASLVSAMLNVTIGNDTSCVASTIESANTWMATYGPVGSNLPASSAAWSGGTAQTPALDFMTPSAPAMSGDALNRQLDDYNNGRLCAPHRQ